MLFKLKRLYMLLYAFIYKVIIKYSNKGDKKSNKILIIFHQPGIGDLVCALDALKNLKLLYPTISSKDINILIDAKLFAFLEKTGCTYGYSYKCINFDNRYSIDNFKLILNELNLIYWDDILIFNRTGYYVKTILLCIAYKDLYYIDFSLFYNSRSSIEILIDKMLENSHCIVLSDDTMEFIIYEELFKLVNNKWSKNIGVGKIPKLLNYNLIKDNYCIVNTGIGDGHSYPYRGWPLERYAQVIDSIIEKYSLTVVLTGDSSEVFASQKLTSKIKNKEKVVNLVGKTNFAEWVEIIRNAKFLLGNDSGYIHIAASVDTMAIVIGGYWNYGRFHPYQNSKQKKYKNFPELIVCSPPSCKFCSRRKEYDVSKEFVVSKQICDKVVKEHSVYKCILDIEVEEVILRIQALL